MNVVHVLLVAAALPCLAAALYLLGLTLMSRAPRTAGRPRTQPAFVVLVPAHDEERGIGGTVRALQAIDYPAPLRRIVVVADNCSDRTAEVAAGHGADVLVRTDARRRGKGYALQFGIQHVLEETDWDALAVVDADTTVSANLLNAFAASFEAGANVVQAAYLPRSAGRGPVAVITEVAFTAFHVVRSRARERLGLSCGLRGNGMAFRRTTLAHVSHTAFSRTEDLEFGVMLGLAGERVAFAGDATVCGDMPEHRGAVTTQRSRWIGGRVEIARRFVPALIREAVRRRDRMLADLAVDLAVPPLSVLVTVAAVGLLASAGLTAATGAPAARAALAAWGLTAGALAIHVWHAARVAGQARALLQVAWAIPGYAADKCLVTLRSFRPAQDQRWIRTLREGEES